MAHMFNPDVFVLYFFFYVVLSFITNSKNDNVNILLMLIFFIDIIPFENYLFVYLYIKKVIYPFYK